jgi:hypothetical protein
MSQIMPPTVLEAVEFGSGQSSSHYHKAHLKLWPLCKVRLHCRQWAQQELTSCVPSPLSHSEILSFHHIYVYIRPLSLCANGVLILWWSWKCFPNLGNVTHPGHLTHWIHQHTPFRTRNGSTLSLTTVGLVTPSVCVLLCNLFRFVFLLLVKLTVLS